MGNFLALEKRGKMGYGLDSFRETRATPNSTPGAASFYDLLPFAPLPEDSMPSSRLYSSVPRACGLRSFSASRHSLHSMVGYKRYRLVKMCVSMYLCVQVRGSEAELNKLPIHIQIRLSFEPIKIQLPSASTP